MRILIGYDGSNAATSALFDLRRAGFPSDTEALIFSVSDNALNIGAAKAAETASAIISSEFPSWQVSAATAAGLPAFEILARSESFASDVIVIGGNHLSNDGSTAFVGETSRSILAKAGCSVRLGRGSKMVDPSTERILVGFDGSIGSAHAVEAIASRKWPAATTVRLLAIADASVLSSIGRFTPQMKDAAVEARFASQWAETLAAASLDKLEEAGLSASMKVRFGPPGDVIIAEATHWKADSIFVGCHCVQNSFERALAGSVSADVAIRANCTVEVVRKATAVTAWHA
jgi:nucleotide-binding universal stress UspA family protein